MALIEEWERRGQQLFRWRGQLPVLFLVTELLFLWLAPVKDDPLFFWRSLGYLFVSLVGFLVRIQTVGHAYERTSGRNREEQVADALNTSGWYSMVRHPLYLGNFLMWLGLVLFTENVWFILFFILLYWLYYERIMFAEEAFLRKKFGERYLEWSERTPAFLPRFRNYRKADTPFNTRRVLRAEYHILLEIPGGFLLLDIVRQYNLTGMFSPHPFWVWLFSGCALLWVIFRVRFKLFRRR